MGAFADVMQFEFITQSGKNSVGETFHVDIDMKIHEANILDYIPFEATMTFSVSAENTDEHATGFYLGDQVFALINVDPLVNTPISSISVNTLTLTQENYEGEDEMTNLMESTYNYEGQYLGGSKFLCHFELESVHFHASIEGQVAVIAAGVEIHYQDGVVR